MPFIQLKVNLSITPEQEQEIKNRVGKAISLLPGKNENWLMMELEDNCRLYFQGDAAKPCAYIAVDLYGQADKSAYNRLTRELTSIMSEQLKIPQDRIYIRYLETSYWGWNGQNF